MTSTAVYTTEFCPLPSSQKIIPSLYNATKNNRPILICGPPACGKSILASHLFVNQHVEVSSPRLIRVQLSDHIDSRQLIGQYCCSEIPGIFIIFFELFY